MRDMANVFRVVLVTGSRVAASMALRSRRAISEDEVLMVSDIMARENTRACIAPSEDG